MRRLVAFTAFAAVAAGCSSSSTSDSDRFLHRADAICHHFGRQANAVPLPDVNTKFMLEHSKRGRAVRHALAAYDRRVSRLGEVAFGRIHRLLPPRSLRMRWKRWLVEVDAAHRAGRTMNRAIFRPELDPGRDAGVVWEAHRAAAYRLGLALGLTTCAIDVRYRQ